MTATRQDIREWLETAQEEGASHLVVVHDTYDHDNFPLYIMPGQDPQEVFHEKYVKDRKPNEAPYVIDECYDLSLDIGAQLNELRAFHWDVSPGKGESN